MEKGIRRVVDFSIGQPTEVDLYTPVDRFSGNPILTARDVNKVWRNSALQVITVHNAGVTTMDGQTIMLFRSHLRCGISVLGVARSKSGIDNWHIEPTPVLKPASESDVFIDGANKEALIENEAGGVEDARITRIFGGTSEIMKEIIAKSIGLPE